MMTEAGTLEVMRPTELGSRRSQPHGQRAADGRGDIAGHGLRQNGGTLENHERDDRAGRKAPHGNHDHRFVLGLVAQRVKKLVTILDEAQHKLVVRVVVFGLQQNGETPVMEGKAGEMLKQLEESKTTAIKQKVADDIRAQFGFQ
jgi:hypothetical protein